MHGLDVRLSCGDGFLVVALAGELDLTTVEPIRERMMAIAGNVPGVVFVDLADVTFMDSTGCSLFVQMQRALGEHRSMLVLTNLCHQVGRPWQALGLDRTVLTTYSDAPVRPWQRPVAAETLLQDFTLADEVSPARGLTP